MKQEHKRWLGIGAVALALVAFAVWQGNQQSRLAQESNQTETGNANESSQAGQQQASSPSAGTASNPPSVVVMAKPSYTEAVNQYKDRRIQFDGNCVALPVAMSVKKNDVLMVDNRGAGSKAFLINNQRHVLAGYDFLLVRLQPSNPLPYDMLVDCGNGQNNATITINQ